MWLPLPAGIEPVLLLLISTATLPSNALTSYYWLIRQQVNCGNQLIKYQKKILRYRYSNWFYKWKRLQNFENIENKAQNIVKCFHNYLKENKLIIFKSKLEYGSVLAPHNLFFNIIFFLCLRYFAKVCGITQTFAIYRKGLPYIVKVCVTL